jgi:hypothetical protein
MDGSITAAQALSMAQAGEGGGMLGYGLSELLIQGFGYTLAWVLLVAVGIAGLVLLMGPLLLASGAMAIIWLRHRRDDRDLTAGWAGNGNGEGVPAPSLPGGSFSWRGCAASLGASLQPSRTNPRW